MAKSEQIAYHVTTSQTWFQNRSQFFVSGTESAFSEVRKSSESGLFSLSIGSLLVPKTKIWDLFWNQVCDVVGNLLTFGHWKVVFLLFLILHRAFPHFMYLRKFKFRKRGRTSPQNIWNKTCSLLWRGSKSGCGKRSTFAYSASCIFWKLLIWRFIWAIRKHFLSRHILPI